MFKCLLVVLVLAICCSFACATTISVGTGENLATITIIWAGGYQADFQYRFSTAVSATGMDALDAIDAALADFSVVKGFGGGYIDGLSLGTHTNSGYAGGENWWHYWVKDAGQTQWVSPLYGAASRPLTDGDSDGWVYGSASAPVPEPVTLALLGLGSVFVAAKRK